MAKGNVYSTQIVHVLYRKDRSKIELVKQGAKVVAQQVAREGTQEQVVVVVAVVALVGNQLSSLLVR